MPKVTKQELQDRLGVTHAHIRMLEAENRQLRAALSATQAREQLLIRTERAAVDSLRELARQFKQVMDNLLTVAPPSPAPASSDLEGVLDLLMADD